MVGVVVRLVSFHLDEAKRRLETSRLEEVGSRVQPQRDESQRAGLATCARRRIWRIEDRGDCRPVRVGAAVGDAPPPWKDDHKPRGPRRIEAFVADLDARDGLGVDSHGLGLALELDEWELSHGGRSDQRHRRS